MTSLPANFLRLSILSVLSLQEVECHPERDMSWLYLKSLYDLQISVFDKTKLSPVFLTLAPICDKFFVRYLYSL